MLTRTEHTNPLFEEQIGDALRRIRSAFADLLNSVGVEPTQGAGVSRRLGLNKNLSWKLANIMRDQEPAAAIPMLPGKPGMRILLKSFEKAGAPADMIAAAQAALESFDSVVGVHAGDRETLELLLSNMGEDGEGQRGAETQRKLSFRGNSAIWGVQARAQICTNIVAPGSDPEWADVAWLSGLLEFRRFRRDARWLIAATRRVQDDGTPLAGPVIEALDPAFSAPNQPPLLGEFCSAPPPRVEAHVGPDGMIRYRLLEGPVGNTAADTCIVGIVGRNLIRRRAAANDTIGEHLARLYTPVELLIHDLFVHRDLDYAHAPQIFLYSQLPIHAPYPTFGRDEGLLPVAERVSKLGVGPASAFTSEIPQYRRMIERVFARTGWDPQHFFGYRFKMRYPPIPSLAILRYALPQR